MNSELDQLPRAPGEKCEVTVHCTEDRSRTSGDVDSYGY